MKKSGEATPVLPIPGFLRGGGEMGQRIREYDWASTSVGRVEDWPQSLRTAIGILLNTKFPMFIWWGQDLIQFYNDAYRPSLGNEGKHPTALGQPGEACWPEIWPIIFPLIQQVRKGGASTWSEDQLIPIYRNGHIEDVYWTFGYSPIIDEKGDIGGVLVVCNETTEKVLNHKKLAENEDQLSFAIAAADLATWDFNPLNYTFRSDKRLKDWFGLEPLEEIDLAVAVEAIIEPDRERVMAAIQRALQYESGGFYDIKYTIVNKKTAGQRIVRAKGRAWFSEDKVAYRFNGTLQDITDQETAHLKMEEREHFAHYVIQNSDAAKIVWLGEDMIIDMVNERMLEILGRDSSILGKPFLQAIPELAATPILQRLKNVLHTGETFIISEDMYILHRHGVPHIGYYNYSYKALRKPAGEIYGIICTAMDVTANVVAKKQIEESEAFARRLFNNSVAAQVVWEGENMVIRTANERMLQIWGRDYSVIGKPFMEAIPELSGTSVMDRLRQVLRTGETYSQPEEQFIIMRQGQPHTGYYNFTFQPLTDNEGKNYAVVCTVIEVTEQVLARQKAEQAIETARLAIESADLGTYEIDLRTDEVVTSSRYNAIFDIQPFFKRVDIAELIHPEDAAGRIRANEEALKTGSLHYEARVKWRDQSEHWIRVKGKAIFDEGGKPFKIIGVVQDITEQKQFAAQLTQQVRERTLELQRSNDDLLQFAHVITHDLKEPVRKVKVFGNRIQDEMEQPLSSRVIGYLHKIQHAADRMNSMIDGVLSYSTMSSGEARVEAIDLNEIIKNIQDDLDILIQQKGAGILYRDLPTIQGVGILLYQLFYNLINNALKFSKKDQVPQITLTSTYLTHSGQHFAQIIVTDNGIGFEQKYAETIFQSFKRLHSKDVFEGTGLGLALSKKIVQRHGGTISATGSEEGATFIIQLPIKQINNSI